MARVWMLDLGYRRLTQPAFHMIVTEFRRDLFLTASIGMGTPGMKVTTGWWVQGAGHVSHYEVGVSLHAGVRLRNCAQQGAGVGVFGMCKNLSSNAHLYHTPKIHDGDPLACMLY